MTDRKDAQAQGERLALSIREAADRISVSHSTLRRRIEDGTIRAVTFGGRTLVPVSELRRLIEEAPAAARRPAAADRDALFGDA